MNLKTEQAQERIIQSKDWRKRMDVILQEMKTQQIADRKDGAFGHPEGAELMLSRRHLEDSIMRLGMRCKAINETNPEAGGDNPYPKSYDATTTKVEPTADGLKM
jgi:hypothetical protein